MTICTQGLGIVNKEWVSKTVQRLLRPTGHIYKTADDNFHSRPKTWSLSTRCGSLILPKDLYDPESATSHPMETRFGTCFVCAPTRWRVSPDPFELVCRGQQEVDNVPQ